jgi:hypothetical protein
MAAYQVTRTDKEDASAGGRHQHIAALCLADGRRVPKAIAISNIKTGRESYYTSVGGRQAGVRVIGRCDRCASEYLRSDPDVTTTNNLLELPDCQ